MREREQGCVFVFACLKIVEYVYACILEKKRMNVQIFEERLVLFACKGHKKITFVLRNGRSCLYFYCTELIGLQHV